MIKSILACTDGSDYGDISCEYSLHLANRLKARLIGLHVLDSRTLEGPLMSEISGWVGAQPYAQNLTPFRELLQQKGKSIIQSFETKAQESKVHFESLLETGHPVQSILKAESKAEVVVLGQKGEHAKLGGEMMGSTAERVVRNSVNPCLVTPQKFEAISKILVAYDGSGHAGKALHEAVELALALRVNLILVTVAESDQNSSQAETIMQDGLKMVQAHDCPVDAFRGHGKASSVILDHAKSQECNLIVMGAFGRARIREMLLGSTTLQVVSKANVPVMMVR